MLRAVCGCHGGFARLPAPPWPTASEPPVKVACRVCWAAGLCQRAVWPSAGVTDVCLFWCRSVVLQVMLPLMLILGIDKLVRESDTTFQPKVVLGYFVVDVLWVLVDPGCVRR